MAYIKNVGGNMFIEVNGDSLTVSGKYQEKSGTIFQQGSDSVEINSSQNIYSNGHGEKVALTEKANKINKRNAHVFFIGGAGDKRPYLGQGPNNNILYAKQFFDKEITSTSIGNKVKSDYLGFYEVYPKSNIDKNIISSIPNKTDVIYIIGHSLGGWNAVYTASYISESGYNVRILMTLDPVGTKNGVHWISELYDPVEDGLYKGKKYRWYNVRNSAKNKNFSDLVAAAGGQATVISGQFGKADTTIDVDINHSYANKMFTIKLYDNKSKSMLDVLKNDIISQLK